MRSRFLIFSCTVAESKIVHLICWEWLHSQHAIYMLFKSGSGNCWSLVPSGRLNKYRVFLVQKSWYLSWLKFRFRLIHTIFSCNYDVLYEFLSNLNSYENCGNFAQHVAKETWQFWAKLYECIGLMKTTLNKLAWTTILEFSWMQYFCLSAWSISL